ncbi:MAG: hypothetical protein AAF603_05235 [Pseudomonadota bacterium]
MGYQTFKAPSVKDARKAILKALGRDAVILSTRKYPDGSVEMRAIEKGQPLYKGEGGGMPRPSLFKRARGEQASAAPPPYPSQSRTPAKSRPPSQEQDFAARAEQGSQKNAMSSLRGDFSQKLSQGAHTEDPLHAHYRALLTRQNISKGLIDALVEEARHAGNRSETERLSFALGRVLKFLPIAYAPDAPIMMVGQTGAGKTSSAAKLAARAAGLGGRVGFMTADVGRAGAVEQLATYADALDTKFWPVDDPQHVADIMRQERPQEQIILDTPGVSPFATADVAAMRAYREAIGAEPILVIPASGDAAEHTDWVKAFAQIGVRRCIVTKFDTSRRIGAALTAAFESGVALAHLSEAPFIADGLIDANPDYLAYRLLMDQPGRIASKR